MSYWLRGILNFRRPDMISMADYWMGRDATCPTEMTPAIETNAQRMIALAQQLLDTAALFGVVIPTNPKTGSLLTSGWRPPSYNCNVPNAAPNSKHMTGQAIDLYDPDGLLDDWLLSEKGQGTLAAIGLWMEHPAATKGWCHVQSVPPKSGRRCFYP
jgi:hypothetical protein